MSIKAIITDVDGVIVGEKIGFNSPYPHPAVIERLRAIRESGIYISLCTGKPYRSVEKIITDARLNDLHIADGGSVVIDPMDSFVLKKHVIDKQAAHEVIKAFVDNKAYTEFYTLDDYFIQQDFQSETTKLHNHVLQFDVSLVDDLAEESKQHDVVKIMPIADNESDKARLAEIFEPFKDRLTLSWGIHPIALPRQFGIITAKDVSKRQAALEIAEKYRIDPGEILGIGDGTSDWQFIEQCGYGAAMGNASKELKDLVTTKGPDRSFVGGHVDENGILAILDHFFS